MTFSIIRARDALFTMLSEAPTLDDIKHKELGEYVNDQSQNCPWLGVYKGPRRETPWTLGRGTNNWRAQPKLVVIVQESGYDAGADVEARLEEWVCKVIDVVKGDPQLRGTVATITEIEVNYSYWRDRDRPDDIDVHYQQAEIVLTAEVRT